MLKVIFEEVMKMADTEDEAKSQEVRMALILVVCKDFNGHMPFDYAMQAKSNKLIEIMLQMLIEAPDVAVSKLVFK